MLARMLMPKPDDRITVTELLQHPWFLRNLPCGTQQVNDRLVDDVHARYPPHTPPPPPRPLPLNTLPTPPPALPRPTGRPLLPLPTTKHARRFAGSASRRATRFATWWTFATTTPPSRSVAQPRRHRRAPAPFHPATRAQGVARWLSNHNGILLPAPDYYFAAVPGLCMFERVVQVSRVPALAAVAAAPVGWLPAPAVPPHAQSSRQL